MEGAVGIGQIRGNTALQGIHHGKVDTAVAQEIAGDDLRGGPAVPVGVGRALRRENGGEGPVALRHIVGDAALSRIDDGDIADTVAKKVAGDDLGVGPAVPVGVGRALRRECSGEGAVAVRKIVGDAALSRIHDGEIGQAVVQEIACDDLRVWRAVPVDMVGACGENTVWKEPSPFEM